MASSTSPLQVSHLETTRLESSKYPIFMRPLEARDAAMFAELLFSKRNNPEHGTETVDIVRGGELIEAHRAKMAIPTIVGADGRVVSGSPKMNLAVILTKDDGTEQMIGLGGYGAIKDWEREGRKVRAGDAGVVIDLDYRGKGYAVEAMKLAMDWAFSPASEGGPQMDIVTVTTSAENAPMIKLAEEKLGLKGMGVKRPGEFDPFEMYWELNKEQWEYIKKTL